MFNAIFEICAVLYWHISCWLYSFQWFLVGFRILAVFSKVLKVGEFGECSMAYMVVVLCAVLM